MPQVKQATKLPYTCTKGSHSAAEAAQGGHRSCTMQQLRLRAWW